MSTTIYKFVVGILSLICIGLLVNTERQALQLSDTRIANQYASDKMWSMRADRQLAIEHYDVTNAVAILAKLEMPVLLKEYGDNRVLMHAVDLERQKAIRDIIESLRVRTGEDHGREPRGWIMAFGDEDTRQNEDSNQEWFKALIKENETRLSTRRR